MAIKSAYRKKPAEEIPQPNIPEVKIDGQKPEASVGISTETDAEPEDVAAAAIGAATEADAAKYALLKQIEALRASEQAQRNAAMAAQRPMTRDEMLAAWKAQGLSEKEAKFLEANPEMIDLPQVSAYAASEAMQAGVERDSAEYFQLTKQNFEKHMKQLKAQSTTQPTPQFFAPQEPLPASRPSPASYTSAPVSRTAPVSGYREPSPSQVRLSPDELLIAANSGISPETYAKNKLLMEKEKRLGLRQ